MEKNKAEKQRKAKKQRGREKQKSRKAESEKSKKNKWKNKKNSPPSKVVLSLRPIMSTKNRDFVGILDVQLCSGWGNLS